MILSTASDAVAVAAVHATIIAILTAITVGYYGVVFGRLHMLGSEIIERANAIGRESVDYSIQHPDEESYDGRDGEDRLQLSSNIGMVALGLPAFLARRMEEDPRPVDEQVPPPGQHAERANYLSACLSLMLRTYPLHGEKLASLPALRSWLALAKGWIESLVILDMRQADVASLLAFATSKFQEDVAARNEAQPHLAAHLAKIDRATNPLNAYQLFAGKLGEIANEIELIESELVRYDDYEGRLFSRWRLGATFAAATIAFASGVLLPLVDTYAPRWVYVGVPCVLYVCGIVVAATSLWRRYGRRERAVDN